MVTVDDPLSVAPRILTGMTTLNDRPGTAVAVIDVQNDVVAGAHRRDDAIANINF